MRPYRKLIHVLNHQLKQGSHPRELSLGVTLGVVLGLLPLPGVTTVLGLLTAMALRLNHVVLQAANYAVYPLQVALLGVYLALGNLWLGTGTTVDDLTRLPSLLGADVVAGGRLLADLMVPGVAAWLLTTPLLGVGIYVLVRPAFAKLQAAATRASGL